VVRFAEVGDSRLMTRALGTCRRRPVAAPAYLAVKGVPLIPDDLKAHACLHHKFPTSGKLERWPLWPEHAGIETEPPRTAMARMLEPLTNLYGRTRHGTLKLYDKLSAMAHLAKLLNLLVDRQEIRGPNGSPVEVTDHRGRITERCNDIAKRTAPDNDGSSGSAYHDGIESRNT
jgi:hypothetical protein